MSSRPFPRATDEWISLFKRAPKSNPQDAHTPNRSTDPAKEVVRGPSPKALDRLIPEVGQSFAGFQLIRELGRGAFGRVFLAEQQELAARPVALKVVPSGGTEVRTLARLQHTTSFRSVPFMRFPRSRLSACHFSVRRPLPLCCRI